MSRTRSPTPAPTANYWASTEGSAICSTVATSSVITIILIAIFGWKKKPRRIIRDDDDGLRHDHDPSGDNDDVIRDDHVASAGDGLSNRDGRDDDANQPTRSLLHTAVSLSC